MKKRRYFGDFVGAYFCYSDVFDRRPALDEIIGLLRDLEPTETAAFLCRMHAEIRLVEKEREPFAKVQQMLASAFLDQETVDRFKQRFGTVHLADRPVFHTSQLLNVLRLVLVHSTGAEDPSSSRVTGDKIGTACLMMNDLLLTAEEEMAISSGATDDRRLALMTQICGPFEVMNPAAIHHVIYRSRIMFHELLRQKKVVERIAQHCNGFDFEQEFVKACGIPLQRWLVIVFSFYAYLSQYIAKDDSRHLEFTAIDATKFRGQSKIGPAELEAVLKTISLPLREFRDLLRLPRPVDWRFDYVPFKTAPFIELVPNKFFCSDIGFLIEKMHTGVYWTMHNALGPSDRHRLSTAWGILFEEYVNWFLDGAEHKLPLKFYASPSWEDGCESFDGLFLQDTRFMPMEYKGGILKMEARYAGSTQAFESDLDKKIGAGCEQLARKLQMVFHCDPADRKALKNIPVNHVTRVVPVLVVQDQILRGVLINWWLNRKFNSVLDRTRIRSGVEIDALNVISIHELETMVLSAETGKFDLFHGLQLRCFRDPAMTSELHNFLMALPGYGEGRSERIMSIVEQQFAEIENSLF